MHKDTLVIIIIFLNFNQGELITTFHALIRLKNIYV